MLELNLGFRSVTYLLICFTSLVQNVGICSCYTEHRIYYENTKTNNIHEYNPNTIHANLTTAKWIQSLDSSHIYRLSGNNKVTVKCTRGDSTISKHHDLLLPYRLWPEETLDRFSSPASRSDLTRSYNPHVDSSLGCGLGFLSIIAEFGFSIASSEYSGTFAEFTDKNETNPWLKTCSEPGLSDGAIVGITLGVVALVLLLVICSYNGVYRKKNAEISSALLKEAQVQLMPAQAPNGSSVRGSESSGGGLEGITVDKAVEFSYEELSKATHDFHLDNKIGQGGFGSVYYAELRAEKAAIKKMDMRASKEFLAELNVLTHVHHLNLVRLIGYCVESSYFMVYEYIENGNLSQHLHGSGRDPLPWPIRVQIALDSARGLEYIHEYTVPVFVHCDIKSSNILIDNNLNAKVADFGLTRLTEVGSRSRLVGTFGYMPPEYAQYGEVSPKVDVYAFGVVLYELISAKKAIIRANGADGEPKGLIALFDEVLSHANPKDELVKMVDPRLGDDYPLDSVHKMAQLAKACTNMDPQRRPSMRSVVVALMTLSSSAED